MNKLEHVIRGVELNSDFGEDKLGRDRLITAEVKNGVHILQRE
jgi:hypothetical protein